MISKIPFRFIKIEGKAYHLMVSVMINNKPANLLIDTGASQTVFDLTSIKPYLNHSDFTENEILSAGLGTNTLTSKSTILDSLIVGDFEILNYPCVLIDMSHVNETYQNLGLQAFEGILGSDILFRYKASIDYKTKILKLRKKSKS